MSVQSVLCGHFLAGSLVLSYRISLYCVRQPSFLLGPWVEFSIGLREQGRDLAFIMYRQPVPKSQQGPVSRGEPD